MSGVVEGCIVHDHYLQFFGLYEAELVKEQLHHLGIAIGKVQSELASIYGRICPVQVCVLGPVLIGLDRLNPYTGQYTPGP